jgi:flagellin
MVGAAPDVTSNVVPVTITRMNATGLAIGDGTNSLVRVDDATLGDGSGDGRARAGIDLIDTAIDLVSSQRSKLGAVSNRLDHTINNLSNMAANVSSARGRIEDADYAMETTNLAKNQILQRASMAMLSQANVSKGSVLGLLRS